MPTYKEMLVRKWGWKFAYCNSTMQDFVLVVKYSETAIGEFWWNVYRRSLFCFCNCPINFKLFHNKSLPNMKLHINWHCTLKEECFLLIYLYSYLFILVQTHASLFYSLGYNSLISSFILILSYTRFVQWESI